MASDTQSVVASVVTAIQASHTHFDLSGTDQVKVGWHRSVSNTTAFCWVAERQLQTFRDADALGPIPMGQYGRELTLDVVAYVPASPDTPEARYIAATQIRDDIMAALEADRDIGTVAYDLDCTGVAINGDEGNRAPGMGMCAIEVHLYWRVVTGG